MITKNNPKTKIIKNISAIAKQISTNSNINLKKFKILKNDQNLSLCLQDSKQKYFAKIFFKNNIESEIYWLKKTVVKNICVPKIITYDFYTNETPNGFEILEYCNNEYKINEMSNEYKYIIAKIIGQNLTKLHKIKVSNFGTRKNNNWTNKSWLDVLNNYSGINNTKITSTLFTKNEITKITKITKDPEMNIKKPVLIHGDTSTSNFIYVKNYQKPITFIDPGNIIGGDPMFDLAYAAIPIESDFYNGLKAGYESEKTMTSKENYRLDRLKLICAVSATITLTKQNQNNKLFIKCAKEQLQKI